MNLKLDQTKEYGLVLEGGGARGSYQIGAWKALAEAGIRIKGVAGASVGSLNGALICMGDLEHACQIWETITYSKVMDIDETMMEQIFAGNWKAVGFSKLLESAGKILKDGGFDVTPLRQLISNAVDTDRLRRSPVALYVRTISLTDRKPLVVDVKTLPDNEIADMLLASAYFPAFRREKLEGKSYLDGGMYDNVPVDILLDQGYDAIIELRIDGIGINRHTPVPDSVTLCKIEPAEDLGGILEFDPERSRKNITLGYYDARRVLYGLKGIHYYIEDDFSEKECFQQLIRLFTAYYQRKGQTDVTLRKITEELLPKIALKVCKTPDWNYEILYLRLLEHAAVSLSIPRFQIYSKGELETLVQNAASSGELEENPDHYVELFDISASGH